MQLSKQAQSLISGEYALGLLPPTVAKRWQRLMAAQPELAEMTAQWQQQLAPMAEWIPEQEVPQSLWEGIEAELFGSASNVLVLKKRPRALTATWLAAAAMAAGVSIWLALPSLMTTHPESSFSTSAHALATLSNEQNSVQWQVLLSDANTLRLQVSSNWSPTPSRSLELWAIDASGTPKSLGLVTLTDDQATLKLSANQQRNLQTATLLAISEEPAGGSPTALPTGPVLFTGKPTRS
ncbi:MAG: anti-sigma factor [Paraperlucidibaca sp.]